MPLNLQHQRFGLHGLLWQANASSETLSLGQHCESKNEWQAENEFVFWADGFFLFFFLSLFSVYNGFPNSYSVISNLVAHEILRLEEPLPVLSSKTENYCSYNEPEYVTRYCDAARETVLNTLIRQTGFWRGLVDLPLTALSSGLQPPPTYTTTVQKSECETNEPWCLSQPVSSSMSQLINIQIYSCSKTS